MTLASRLMASAGSEVALDLAGVGRVAGALQRVGTGWCLVRAARVGLAGATRRGRVGRRRLGPPVPEVAWSPLARLGPGRHAPPAGRRGCAERGGTPVSGGRRLVSLTRVGRDFVEAVDDAGRGLLLPLATLGRGAEPGRRRSRQAGKPITLRVRWISP